METKTAAERLAAGEAVHPDDMTDAELLALLPMFATVIRRVALTTNLFTQADEMVESELAA